MNGFLADPRILGMKEHLHRIKRFSRNAKRCKKQESKFRNLISAIYPARAIAELMFECADKKLINQSRDDLKKWFEEEISFFLLIEKIRIHDFHRFGCLPPSKKYKTLFIGGPIKLRASSGYASIQMSPKGKTTVTTGNSSIAEQRPLYNDDGLFYDESSDSYKKLDDIIEKHTQSLEKIISKFEKLITIKSD